MRKVIGTMLIALAIVSAGDPRPAAGQATKEKGGEPSKAKAADYYPLAVGTKWHYEIENGNGQKVQLVYQIAKLERIEGRELARLEIIARGQKTQYTEHLHSDAAGVYRDRMHNLDFSPPLCLIKYPVKTGERWTSEFTAGGHRMKVEGTAGPAEEVKVPAGKFRAIPCSLTISDGKDSSTTINWFAPGVGIVKQKTPLGTRGIFMELTRFEAATP